MFLYKKKLDVLKKKGSQENLEKKCLIILVIAFGFFIWNFLFSVSNKTRLVSLLNLYSARDV